MKFEPGDLVRFDSVYNKQFWGSVGIILEHDERRDFKGRTVLGYYWVLTCDGKKLISDVWMDRL